LHNEYKFQIQDWCKIFFLEMVLSCELTERVNDCGGVLDLTGLALNANANTLAAVLSTKPVTHLVLADCMLEQSAANRLIESITGLIALDLRGNDLRGRSVRQSLKYFTGKSGSLLVSFFV